jgi:diaminopimelate epimerase
MTIHFSKYQATGNDFILIDNRKLTFPALDNALIARLCHRRFGIGADGLMLLQQHPEYDFEMVYFNADGNLGSFCGNGSRSIVKFAERLGLATGSTCFLASDGVHEATILKNGVRVKMSDVNKLIPTEFGLFLNTGSPHVVIAVDAIEYLDVDSLGKKVRHDPIFSPGGTNVNFAKFEGDKVLVRTFERGVEAETLSCGTGVVASAIAAAERGFLTPVKVVTPGGNLEVSFLRNENHYSEIWLSGNALHVFDGDISV